MELREVGFDARSLVDFAQDTDRSLEGLCKNSDDLPDSLEAVR